MLMVNGENQLTKFEKRLPGIGHDDANAFDAHLPQNQRAEVDDVSFLGAKGRGAQGQLDDDGGEPSLRNGSGQGRVRFRFNESAWVEEEAGYQGVLGVEVNGVGGFGDTY